MKLIVETDLGRDPDDFFALCYFIEAGVDIKLITISPGDPDQVAVAKFLLKECGLNIPVGVSRVRNKKSVGGVHLELLQKYGYPITARAEGIGSAIIQEILQDPEVEYFGCGPLDSIKESCLKGPYPKRATIQGGYVSYEYLEKHGVTPRIKLAKFVGQDAVTTFNLCGNIEAGKVFINSPFEKRCVSKNVCHTIVYDKYMHETVSKIPPKGRAGELLREGMDLYLKKHPEGKKFHDPSAAVCHLHPEIGEWVKGRLIYEKGKWGTIDLLPYNCEIIGNVDMEALIQHIAHGT